MMMHWLNKCAGYLAVTLFGVVAACTSVPGLGGPPSVGDTSGWSQYESDSFTLISDVSTEDAKAFLEELEDFRTFVRATLNPVGGLRPRLTIIAPTSRASFAPFGNPDQFGGLYFRTIDTDFLVINLAISDEYNRRSNGSFTAADILRHEYVHAVVADTAGNPLPLWINEGYAEFFSTARRDGDVFIVGEPLPERLTDLKRANRRGTRSLRSLRTSRQTIPLHRLVEVESLKQLPPPVVQSATFHAQSWLVFHLLYRSEEGRQTLEAYLDQRDQRGRDTRALEAALGQTISAFDRDVWRWSSRQDFPTMRLPAPPKPEVTFRRVGGVSRADLTCNIGRFQGFVADADRAKQYFRRAIELDPENICALSHLSKLEAWDENFEIAEELVRRAEAQNGDDPFTPLARAMIFFNRYRISDNVKSFPRAAFDAGLADIEKAIAADPSIALSHWMYALLVVLNPDATEDDVTLALERVKEAQRLQPQGAAGLHWVRGNLSAQLGFLEEAMSTFRQAESWSPVPEQRRYARRALARLEDMVASLETDAD